MQNSNRINKFLLESNLKNIISTKHEGVLPRTYDRGPNCLDLCAILNVIDNKAIKKCGYLPFYEGTPSDHRPVYIDLDTDYFFTNANQDKNKPTLRRFMTDQPKATDKYLKTLEEELETSRVFKKAKELEVEMNTFLKEGKGNEAELIRRCQTLSEKTSQLMIHSERSVGRKHYCHGYPSSPKLKQIAHEIIGIKKVLRCTSLYDTDNKAEIDSLKKRLKEKKT